MREFFREIRISFRSLAKQPGLALLAILALGLGIGFTAIMFSIVHGALYRGLPFPDGDRIYAIMGTNPSEGIEQTQVSVHDYLDWRDQQTSMEELATFYNGTINVTSGEAPDRYDGAFMTASAFRVVGVQPFLGRAFRDEDDRPGAPVTLILGYQVWRDHFGSNQDVLGQSVKVNGEWLPPEQMFSPLAGEPSIDREGNIYFTHHYYKDDEMIEADIYVAYRK